MTEQELVDYICTKVISSETPSFGGVTLFNLIDDIDNKIILDYHGLINEIRIIYYACAFSNDHKQFRTDDHYKYSFCKKIKEFAKTKKLNCPDVVLNFELLK